MNKSIKDEQAMEDFGKRLGEVLSGGELIELIGDIGAGKTVLTRGIALGLKVTGVVQSPSFTINRRYDGRNGLSLAHYDFYRLDDAGLMRRELAETLSDVKAITIIEWSDVISDILPTDRLSIKITSPSETTRQLDITSGGEVSDKLVARITK